jgi:ATP-dependent helicase/DNAse subunit B
MRVERAMRSALKGTMRESAIGGFAALAARTIEDIEAGGGTHDRFANGLLSSAVDASGIVHGGRILERTWEELLRLRNGRARSTAEMQHSAIALLHTNGVKLLQGVSLVVLEDLPLARAIDVDLIDALIKAARCDVIATSEYASQLTSAPATVAYANLRSLTTWDERECIGERGVLGIAANRLFGPMNTQRPDATGTERIVRLESAGETAETHLAARIVRRHLRGSTGVGPVDQSDILIVARQRRHRKLIHEIFPMYGLDVNASTATAISDTPLGAVVLSVLRMARDASGGTRGQALAVLRTPHLDVGAGAIDRLERRVIKRGQLGIESWDDASLDGLGERTIRRVRRLKRAVSRARKTLATATTHQQMSRVVYRLARDLRLLGNAYFARKRTIQLAADPALEEGVVQRSIRLDNQAWEEIEDILDGTMPDLLAEDARANDSHAETFCDRWMILFERTLGAEQIRSVRTDSGVRVTGALNGDCQPARVTIIMGLRQQAFPRQARQNPFLRDDLCARLTEYGIQIPTSEDAADAERESFVRAIASAGEALYLSYAATDAAGKPAVASFFIEDLQRAVGSDRPFVTERLGVADTVPKLEDAASRAQLLASTARDIWQRLPADSADSARAAGFHAWNELLDSGQVSIAVSGGRVAQRRPSFDSQVMRGTPHATLELSASQLRYLHHCTYEHYVKSVLHPDTLDVDEYGSLTRGSLVHEAMLQWARLDGWSRGAAALDDLDAWFARRVAQLPPAAQDGPLAQFMIAGDRARLRSFVKEELAAVVLPDAPQPIYHELAFGKRAFRHGDHDPASQLQSLDLPVDTSRGSRTVKLSGLIDRVDTFHSNGDTFGIVLDYKTGTSNKRYAKAMRDGTELQVRLYLLALEKLWNIKPVGALYVGFDDGVRRGVVSELAMERIGVIDPEVIDVLSATEWDEFVYVETGNLLQPLIERLVTLDIIAQPYKNDCGYCELNSICRYDRHESDLTSV